MKNPNKEYRQILDDDLITLLSLSVRAMPPTNDVKMRMKELLFKKVEDAFDETKYFIFANMGRWVNAMPGVEVKILHETQLSKSYLVKLSAHAEIPEHNHTQNEESFVIEGEVMLDGTLCRQGDYHFAAAGSQHSLIRSDLGCTLLVKTS